MRKGLLLLVLLLGSPVLRASVGLQSLEFERLFIKWLPGSYESPSRCFKGNDRILKEEDTPRLRADSVGLYYNLEIELDRTKEKCSIELLVPEEAPEFEASKNISIRESEGEFNSVWIKIKARPPFEQLTFVDGEGRRIELLLETRLGRPEDQNFLRFFKRSRFMGRALMLTSPSFQFPIALLDYELPTFFDRRLLFQVQVGQTLIPFNSNPYYYGLFDLAAAWRFVGKGAPMEEPYTLKARLVYEGAQVTLPEGDNTYPVTASRLFGVGLEGAFRLHSFWSAWTRNDFLIGQTPFYQVKKIKSEVSVGVRLSRLWRIEAGARLVKILNTDRSLGITDTVNEFGFFGGLRLTPENFSGN